MLPFLGDRTNSRPIILQDGECGTAAEAEEGEGLEEAQVEQGLVHSACPIAGSSAGASGIGMLEQRRLVRRGSHLGRVNCYGERVLQQHGRSGHRRSGHARVGRNGERHRHVDRWLGREGRVDEL